MTITPTSGELITDRPGRRVELLVDDEALAVTHFRYTGAGPQPHVHHLHADCFLVLDGTLRMRVGDDDRLVEPLSWVQVPHDVVHTFSAADGEATFLNFHAPAAGFGGYLRGESAVFDQHDPPPEGGRDPSLAVVRRLGNEGETITDRPGRRLVLLADTDEIAATESLYGPGEQGPELHVHREHTDVWLVLEGVLTLDLGGDASIEAGPGTLLAVPPHVAHGFANKGPVETRFLNFHIPSCGFGAYLRGENPGFDQHEPPPDGGADPEAVLVRTIA